MHSIPMKINELKKHPFYKRYFKKFKRDDYEYMAHFIVELMQMNQDQRILSVVRSAMRDNKPKHWAAIEELLSIAIKED